MALPPGFLDELRARVPISEVVGRRVTWDMRKSNTARGDFWACCPFHEEKSPSFHADDRKGFYHCFGCGAKGDAVSFLREQGNLGFMEAVEELARMAGLQMPAQDPAAAERAKARKGLAEWMEAAAAYFRTQLAGGRAAEARAYLARRGLSRAALERFGLGYAPGDRRALTEHLRGMGAPERALVDAGLSIAPEDGGPAFDRFRDRVMFPIRDAQGVCIAFGGRAMGDGAKAKYLNSPQTPLFDKSRTLYNLGPAREAAGKAGALIAAEGYMDVIALSEAGFAHAVAPLGTAVTAPQLEMMWRMADEPVLALDGDKAGLDAALRVVDAALPLLKPGKSLRFALLPEGRDPDDLIRAEGAGAMRAVLEAAEPLVAMLWRRETEGRPVDSPERRAALDMRLRAALAKIADPDVRTHYRAALAERRAAFFRPAREARGGWSPGRPRGATGGFGGAGGKAAMGRGAWGAAFIAAPLAETKATALLRGAETRAREAAILLALSGRPALLERFGEQLAELSFESADLEPLRRGLAALAPMVGDMAAEEAAVAARAVVDPAHAEDLANRAGAAHLGFAGTECTVAEAEAGLADAIARCAAAAQLLAEVRDAEVSLGEDADASLDMRLRTASAMANRLREGAVKSADSDESHLSDAVRAAISEEIWVKRPR